MPGPWRRGGSCGVCWGECICPIQFPRWGNWCRWVTTDSYKPPRSLFLTTSHRSTSVWDLNGTALFLSSHWNQPHPISIRWPHHHLSKHTFTSLFTLATMPFCELPLVQRLSRVQVVRGRDTLTLWWVTERGARGGRLQVTSYLRNLSSRTWRRRR